MSKWTSALLVESSNTLGSTIDSKSLSVNKVRGVSPSEKAGDKEGDAGDMA
jgi:hypothetical protein